jgi:FkbM family methyltransferase
VFPAIPYNAEVEAAESMLFAAKIDRIETVQGRYGTFHCQPDDFWITRSLKLYGEWSQGECDLYARIVKPGDTVVEVGSNIGTHTVPLAQLAGEKGTVIAFEALEENYNLLGQNTQSVRTQTMRICAALGNGEDGKFIRTGNHTTSGSEFNGGQRFDDWLGTQKQIRCGPLKESLAGWTMKRLDFMKLDCEGSELRVLNGAEKAIMRFRPILYVEDNPGPQFDELVYWLHDHKYRLHQHQIPLYNPNNFRGYNVNVFGGVLSRMLLCVPAERFDIHFDDIPRLRVHHTGGKPKGDSK